jgi:gliding motility-associated-like protein
VNYSTAGYKTVQLIISNGVGDTLVRNNYITVNAIPVTSVETKNVCGTDSVDFLAITNADQVEFSLNSGISVTETDSSAPFIYSALIEESSSLQVWARAINTSTGCAGTWDSSGFAVAYKVPVAEPIASAHTGIFPAGYVDVECRGKDSALYYVNGDPLASYNWRITALGIEAIDTLQFSINWDVPGGDYQIELEKISRNGCHSLLRDTLVLVSQPDPDLGGNVSMCEGDSVVLTIADDYTGYLWNNEYTDPTYTTKLSGEVSVKVWDAYDCEGYDTVLVILNANPSVNLGEDTVLCGDNSLSLDAGDFVSYDWSNNQIGNPITVREGAGVVSVTVTDVNGCEAYDEIFIGECTPVNLLVIPNTFTPNIDKDGHHDLWDIKNIDLFPDADIQVFDRWGRRVYQSYGGSGDKWDGKGPNGNDLPVDTYYYIIDLKVKGQDILTGTISIVR